MALTILTCWPLREPYDAPLWRIQPGEPLGPLDDSEECTALTRLVDAGLVQVIGAGLRGWGFNTVIRAFDDVTGDTRDYMAVAIDQSRPCVFCQQPTDQRVAGSEWRCASCAAQWDAGDV